MEVEEKKGESPGKKANRMRGGITEVSQEPEEEPWVRLCDIPTRANENLALKWVFNLAWSTEETDSKTQICFS